VIFPLLSCTVPALMRVGEPVSIAGYPGSMLICLLPLRRGVNPFVSRRLHAQNIQRDHSGLAAGAASIRTTRTCQQVRTILSVFWKIPPHVSALVVSEGCRSTRIDDSLRRTIGMGQPAPGSKSFAANAAVRPQRAPNTAPIQYLPSTGAKPASTKLPTACPHLPATSKSPPAAVSATAEWAAV
jgi:hypothetical protein